MPEKGDFVIGHGLNAIIDIGSSWLFVVRFAVNRAPISQIYIPHHVGD